MANRRKMSILDKQELIRKYVSYYFDKNAESSIFEYEQLSHYDKEHIISIGTSIMSEKLLGISGGGFVNAINEDSLFKAFSYADLTNQRALKFYVMLVNNITINLEETVI